MPEVVLRHPDLPGQPFVLNLSAGEKIPYSYKERGYVIDADTSPDDARAEYAQTVQAATDRAAQADAEFVPEFEDAPSDASASPEVAAAQPPAAARQPAPVSDPSSGAPDQSNPQGDSPDVTKE